MKNAINRQKLYLESSFRIRQLVNQSLQRKYDTAFHFFRAKWINQLLDGPRHHPSYQKFLDLRIDVEQVEFLKRFYYIKTPTGKLEIESRIKLCTEFYADKMDLAYQYPTIFITNTKSLFLRRNKRLKKIQAGEGSSDETERNQEEYQVREEHSSNFLEGLEESRIQQEDIQSDLQLSFQSNPYDIYEYSVIIKDSSLPKIKLKEISEREVSHLIDEGIISQLRQNSRKNTAFNIQSQHKQEKQSRISVVPIQQRLIGSKQKKSGMLSNYFDTFLDQKMGFGGLGFAEHPLVTQHKNNDFNILKLNSNSIQKERQQRTQRRQKIRQKAQELLKKVRQDQQLDPIS